MMKFPSDTRNSYRGAPDYMQNKYTFEDIASWCGVPEEVPYVWGESIYMWINGYIYDKILLDYVYWYTPELLKATECLIDVYSGGQI